MKGVPLSVNSRSSTPAGFRSQLTQAFFLKLMKRRRNSFRPSSSFLLLSCSSWKLSCLSCMIAFFSTIMPFSSQVLATNNTSSFKPEMTSQSLNTVVHVTSSSSNVSSLPAFLHPSHIILDGQVYLHHQHLFPAGSLTSLQTMDSSISLNERLLQHQQRLQAATSTSGDAMILLKEPVPHFPVGTYGLFECGICLIPSWMYKRACCSFPACSDCLTSYFEAKLDLGIVSIECVNHSCKKFVHRDEISVRLPQSRKSCYYKLLANSNADELSKTCPRCNHIHRLDSLSTLKNMKRQAAKDATSVR